MKVKNRKLLSMIAVLAVSATTVCGAMSFAACGKDDKSTASNNTPLNVNTISSATGEVVNHANGKSYYVTPEATREGSGTSWSDPIALYTLLNSKTILQPGDTVYVQPGVYNWSTLWANPNPAYSGYGIIMEVSGAYNNYINIVNAALDPASGYTGSETQALLSFYGMDFDGNNRGVEIDSDYIYWYGIDVAGAGDNGIYVGGNYNTIEYCDFYDNRDTGLQLGRSKAGSSSINDWPSYNLIKNCTSHNNYDNETYGENADGFAAKLTVGFGNVFDGCIAYRNSDDGWDLYAKTDTGNIGQVIMYNCVAFDNGYLEYTQRECNAKFPTWRATCSEDDTNPLGRDSYCTRDGDGNGFKLGGSVMEGDVIVYNCLAFNNRMHGVTDNSNPGVISVSNTTSYNNSAMVDDHRYVQVQTDVDENNNPVYGDSANLNPYFGKILDVKNKEEHGNINLARQTYSYNNVSHVLAVGDSLALSLEADEYRASVIDSVMGSFKIVGCLDADTQRNKKGDPVSSPIVSSEVFEKLPFTKADNGEYTFNIVGLENSREVSGGNISNTLKPDRVHVKYRNAIDGSINMHDMLAVKDYTKLLGDENKIGSILNLGTYGAYEHFYKTDLVNGSAASANEAIVDRAVEALQLNCNPEAVYQNFDVPFDLKGCSVRWSSEDTNILVVHDNSDEVDVSYSGSQYIIIEVFRDENVDKTVKLTATISYGGVTKTKEFNVTVKSGKPAIGEVQVTTQNGEVLTNGSVIILDKYSVYREPTVQVTNGIDYSGKILASDKYQLKSQYYYATDSKAKKMQIKGFTPSNAGVYTITHTVTMDGESVSMTYYVYVASADANVDFVDNTVSVYRDGYTIAGEVSSATGALYTVTSATPLSLTTDSIKTYDGVKIESFRGERIAKQFANSNSSEYYIYYALGNVNGEITSEVYEKKVNIVKISTAQNFMKVAGGVAISGEDVSTTIYQLENDIDFNGTSYSVGTGSFMGLLNGMGHTIKNVTVSADSDNVGLFYKVEGGTIENIKFDNIKLTGKQKVGLVASGYGGYYYNIAVTNISLSGTQRVGGLIAHVYEGVIPTYVNQVSVINEIPEIDEKGALVNASSANVIRASSNRASGIIGLIQGTSTMTESAEVYIADCFVQSYIVCGTYTASSIVGEYQDDYAAGVYALEIDHCVSNSVIVSEGSSSRLGGIVGYQKGLTAMQINYCVSIGQFFYKNVEVKVSQKNLSGILGNYSSAAATQVNKCVALMEEYNTDYDVTVYSDYALSRPALFSSEDLLGFDMNHWTLVYKVGDNTSIESPYVTLNFLGDWE
ncbi:MAG: hypothetical protein K2K60_00335 [Clostridia bacterium]|nr:hypothetical protein [Clostridia bacterium]